MNSTTPGYLVVNTKPKQIPDSGLCLNCAHIWRDLSKDERIAEMNKHIAETGHVVEVTCSTIYQAKRVEEPTTPEVIQS